MKTYKVPTAVGIALSTDRVEFLSSLSDEKFLSEVDAIPLLRDLIEDRAKLRPLVAQSVESLENLRGQLDASIRKFRSLQNVLDGVADEEPTDEA